MWAREVAGMTTELQTVRERVRAAVAGRDGAGLPQAVRAAPATRWALGDPPHRDLGLGGAGDCEDGGGAGVAVEVVVGEDHVPEA